MMSSPVYRIAQSQIDRWMDERQIIALIGMRRVGKTTLLKYYFSSVTSDNKVFYDLEDVLTRKIFSQENYRDIVRALEQEGITFTQKSYIFIDEVQYVKNITSVMKYLYDTYDVKFVVSGSSSFYLKNHFTESLAGRKIVIELHPFTFREFLDAKQITKTFTKDFGEKVRHKSELDEAKYHSLYQEYIDFGGFPEVIVQPEREKKNELLRDIINSYFQIDVTALADFSHVSKLRDLLILLTQRIGRKINITNLSQALHTSRDDVYRYLSFLRDTFVIALIPQMSSIDNKVSADDKLYFTDTGMAKQLADISEGSLFENSIYMNLVYEYAPSYYQTQSGGEIDFVLNDSCGLEAKLHVDKRDLSHLGIRARSAGLDSHFAVSMYYSPLEAVVMAWDM